MTDPMVRYVHIGQSPSGKTSIFQVYSALSGAKLGIFKWYAPWRKYAFFPYSRTLFDSLCMRQIATHCERLTESHRDAKLEKSGA